MSMSFEDTGENHNPHQPYECPHQADGVYIRDGARVALCGDCTLPGDVECEDIEDNEGGENYE